MRYNSLSFSNLGVPAYSGGYFDAEGHVHYLHNAYQGSVVLVTDSAGTAEQSNTYYPYGEPHRTPAGQPILYGGILQPFSNNTKLIFRWHGTTYRPQK